jgi:hypothetical protein
MVEHTFDGKCWEPGRSLVWKALATGNPLLAISAAAAMERMALDDALALAILLLRAGDRRGTRAAARALGRYATELHRVDLDELALMVDGLERVARGEVQPYRLCIALDARQLREARQQLGL